MKVEITEFAEWQLRRIYEYYRSVASERVALKIKIRILSKASSLKTFPRRGQTEGVLEEYKKVTGMWSKAITKLSTR